MRQQYGQTVNVLLVNYPEQAIHPNTVFEVAELLNERNVQMYLPTTTTYSAKSTIATSVTAGNCQRYTLSIYILLPTVILAMFFNNEFIRMSILTMTVVHTILLLHYYISTT